MASTMLRERILQDSDNDAYEFVAFLLWYVFLVLCCVVPTCCAYRRRRIVEHRLALQQANMNRLQHSNLFILSNLHNAPRQNTERMQQERLRILTDELKGTTMTVKGVDLEDLSEVPLSCVVEAPVVEVATMEEDDEDETPITINEQNGEPTKVDECQTTGEKNCNIMSYEEEIDYTEDMGIMHLPSEGVNGDRSVAGVCAICLCPYEGGDQVSWSPESKCQHAFHTDCIVPWLAKKEEPKCPVCRQEFCPMAVVEDELAREEENSFLESFSRALALSHFYRSEDSTGNGIPTRSNLESTNISIQSQYAAAMAAEQGSSSPEVTSERQGLEPSGREGGDAEPSNVDANQDVSNDIENGNVSEDRT